MGWFQSSTPKQEAQSCAQCGGPIRDGFGLNGDPFHIAMRGKKYCSEKCYGVARKADPLGLVTPPEPSLPVLPPEDQKLLEGKGSKGMALESGRCLYCGQIVHASNELFCSSDCRAKAIRPFLPIGYDRELSDDSDYRRNQDLIQEVIQATDEEFLHASKELDYRGDRSDLISKLGRKALTIKQAFHQEKLDRENEALQSYLKNYQLQRDHVLKIEQEKALNEGVRELTKRDEAARRRREKEDEMNRREQERQAKEQERQNAEAAELAAYEESIAPRPVPDSARLESTLIVAGGGWGKTQLLKSIIAADLQKDDPPSYIVLDSTGAMVETIQRLQVFDDRLSDRILILDPALSPALNMLDFSAPRYSNYTPEQMEDLETEITSLFNYVFASNDYDLSGQMGTAFAYAIKLMMSRKGSTLLDLTRLLEERPKSYRQSAFAEDIERLNYGQDFFEHHFFVDSLANTRAAIARRIHSLLKTAAFRRMFGVSANKLDLFDEMNKGTIVLVNTNVNLLKEDGMALFGRYIIGRALGAAFERATIPFQKRKPTFLMIDEAAPYFDETFEKLFTRARQFRVANVVSFQHLLQASDRLVSGLTSSTRVKYAGALSATDRRRLALDMETTPELIASLKKDLNEPPQWAQFACYVRPDFPTACIQTIQFHQLERMPQMSDEAHRRLLQRNRSRLAPDPLPERKDETVLASIAPTEKPIKANSAPSSSTTPSDDADEWV